jgi:hypothetical protein
VQKYCDIMSGAKSTKYNETYYLASEVDARIAELEQGLREFLDVRDWCMAAGGNDRPLPQDVIDKFAVMQVKAVDNARALLAPVFYKNEGRS